MSANSKSLQKALAKHLSNSILPGEASLEGAALDGAAQFLLEAASKRGSRKTVITHESDTGERRLRIAIVNNDMPFLVDSIAATITAAGVGIDQLLHPIVSLHRDEEGMLTGFAKAEGEGSKESLIYIETPRIDAKQRRELLAALRQTLGDVRASVGDWP